MYKNFKDEIISICEANPDKEVCGFVFVDNNEIKVVECDNIHEDPKNFFKIKTDDYLFIKDKYELIASFHSHPSSEHILTEFDELNADELALPMYIYSLQTKDFFVYKPNSCYNKELKGRMFVPDLYNCVSCAFDYYVQKFNLQCSKNINWAEPKNIKRGNELALEVCCNLDRYLDVKIEEIDKSELQVNDLIIIKTLRSAFYHYGILVNSNQIIHHAMHSVSSIVSLDDRWMNFAHRFFRVSPL